MFFHVLSCSFCKYGLAISSHEPWVSFPEQMQDVKIGLKMFHEFSWYSCPHWYCAGRCSRCREAPVLQVCGLFGTWTQRKVARYHELYMNYHDKTMQCGHPGWKRRNVRAAFTSSLACEYDCICRYRRYLWSKDIESVVQSPRFSDSAKMMNSELRFAKMLSQGQLTEAEDWKIDCSKTKHGPSESLVALAKWIKVIFKMKSIEPLWTISLCGQSSFFDMRLGCRCRCKKKKTRRCHQDLCRSFFWI